MAAGEKGIALLVWIIVFTVLCSMALGLRFWAAILTRRKFFADDFMVVFAFANTVALEGVCIWAIYHGLGMHTNELTADEFGVQFKLIIASGITWLLGTVFIKMSVLWLYTRIFATPAFKRWSYAIMALVVGYGVGFIVVFMTKCQPLSQMWAPVPGGWCRDLKIEELASVTINIALDAAIVVLPMPVLWGLQMPIRNKVFISVMFSIGFLTVGIMVWRLHETIVPRPDFVYSLADIGLLSLLELWLGIIVACLPTLAPLLKTYVKPALSKLSLRSSSNRNSAQQNKPRNALNTIGGSGPGSSINSRRNKVYEMGSDSSSCGDLDEERLTGEQLTGEPGLVTTECAYSPRIQRPQGCVCGAQGGIYVQQAIRTEDTWKR